MGKLMLAISAIILFLQTYGLAADGQPPPSTINSMNIVQATLAQLEKNSHLQWIGECFWWQCDVSGCGVHQTMELDEYEPDLIVSVYNGVGTDAWQEANQLLDTPSHALGNSFIETALHVPLGNGHTHSANSSSLQLYTKSVDVIGNPAMGITLPFELRSDTKPFMPYYQSDLDSVASRTGIAESLRPEAYGFSHPIGQSALSHWGYEFPRSMQVKTSSDYKAALIIAQHAADIVTNNNFLHAVHSTSDSCGTNCAVANVIEETTNKNEIWQEVYPNNHLVDIGENDSTSSTSIGNTDEQDGNGNYVFVLWRHYRGCIQGGQFLSATVSVPSTQKR